MRAAWDSSYHYFPVRPDQVPPQTREAAEKMRGAVLADLGVRENVSVVWFTKELRADRSEPLPREARGELWILRDLPPEAAAKAVARGLHLRFAGSPAEGQTFGLISLEEAAARTYADYALRELNPVEKE
jgi:hypothetical protein